MAVALGTVLAGAGGMEAQTGSKDSHPGLYGYVQAASTGEPVGDVGVTVEGGIDRTVTNAKGFFALDQLPAGIAEVRLRHLAFEDHHVRVRLLPGRSYRVDVRLATAVHALEPLTVTVRPGRRLEDMRAFERRREIGSGVFFGREELERRPALRVGNLLREMPGVRLAPAGSSAPRRSWAVEMRGRQCEPVVWIDGRRVRFGGDLWLSELGSTDLEALEIYGSGATPVEFYVRPCVTLVAWTRRGG